MPQALPYVAAGLGILNTVQGAGQQGQQEQINRQQLLSALYQQHLGKLLGEQGAVGNPFSASYGKMFADAPDPYQQSRAPSKLGRLGLGGLP